MCKSKEQVDCLTFGFRRGEHCCNYTKAKGLHKDLHHPRVRVMHLLVHVRQFVHCHCSPVSSPSQARILSPSVHQSHGNPRHRQHLLLTLQAVTNLIQVVTPPTQSDLAPLLSSQHFLLQSNHCMLYAVCCCRWLHYNNFVLNNIYNDSDRISVGILPKC